MSGDRNPQAKLTRHGSALAARLEHAVAASDRWFVAAGKEIVRVGSWARRGVEDMTATAVAVARDVESESTSRTRAMGRAPSAAQGLVGASGEAAAKPRGGSLEPGRRQRHVPPPTAHLGGGARSRGRAGARPHVATLELLVASAAGASDSSAAPRLGVAASPVCESRAGVAPFVQALGEVVSSHAEQAYGHLHEDRRFWTLMRVIDRLSAEERSARAAASGVAPALAGSEPTSGNGAGGLRATPARALAEPAEDSAAGAPPGKGASATGARCEPPLGDGAARERSALDPGEGLPCLGEAAARHGSRAEAAAPLLQAQARR